MKSIIIKIVFIRLRQKTTTVKSWTYSPVGTTSLYGMSASGAGEISPMNFGGNGASRADTPRRYRRGVRLRRDFAEAPKETMGVLRQAQDGERSRTINPWCFISLIVCVALASISQAEDQMANYKFQGKRDPFVPLISPAGYLLNLEPQDDSALRLEGIMYDPKGDSIAIINGELVRVGETIGDAVVSSIEQNKVVVLKNKEKLEIELRREE